MPNARVVIDTNVLISHLLVAGSPASLAASRALAHTQVLMSDATLSELADVLGRAKFDRYASRESRQDFFRLIARITEVVPITTTVRACRDPKDDKFLEVAISGDASLIVTGDGDLLALAPFRTVGIVTPAQFLALPASALTGVDDDKP